MRGFPPPLESVRPQRRQDFLCGFARQSLQLWKPEQRAGLALREDFISKNGVLHFRAC